MSKSEKWKEEYRTNPKYRDRITRNSIRYIFAKKHIKRRKKKAKRRDAFLRQFGYIFESKGETYYTAKYASEKTRLAYETFRMYVWYHKIIPKPIYFRNDTYVKSLQGDMIGYFSETQIKLINKAFGRTKKQMIGTRADVKKYLFENWTKYEKNL